MPSPKHPFAVSADLSSRGNGFVPPSGWDLQLADLSVHGYRGARYVLPGFAELWVSERGGPEVATRHLWRCYTGAKTAEDFAYPDGLGEVAHHFLPPPSGDELKERGVGLAALAMVGPLSDEFMATLATAFGCSAKATKLAERVQAGLAVHPADSWFSAEVERRVATGLAATAAREASEGATPTKAFRWDLYVLVSGYATRRRPLPREAIYACLEALELLDHTGTGRTNVPLAGISDRRNFVLLAAEEASRMARESLGLDEWNHAPADHDQYWSWKEHPLYVAARNATLAELGLDDDLENLPGYDEDDA